MALRRLHPDSAPLTAADVLADVDFRALAPDDRPYVIVNMVASADGRATLAGRTAQLSNEPDRDLFHALRTVVDAVLVGTGTLRAERYGRMARSPERQEQRRARGLDPEPYAIVLSRRGDFPTDIPLFTDPEARVLRYAGEDAALPSHALRRAYAEHDVRAVLCEGGPTLNASLLAEDLIDELFLCVSPLLANGPAPLTILESAGLDEAVPLELVWVLEGDGALFLRYAVARDG